MDDPESGTRSSVEGAIALIRRQGSIRLTAIILPPLFAAGCSGRSDEGTNPDGHHGLEKSEIIVLKKAGKGRVDLLNAQVKKKFEIMKEGGVAVETTKPGKKTTRPR